MLRRTVFITSILLSLSLHADVNLTNLAANGISKWEHKSFEGETRYESLEYKERAALKAISKHAASGYYLKKKIDLLKTPYLNWSWLLEKPLQTANERSKPGDDYAARVYVVIDGGFMIWKTQSLNYVWSASQEENLVWNNPFAGENVKMISVKGKNAQTGQWYDEKRNVYQDLITHFGDKGSDKENREAYRYIDVIAIMSDTDNGGGEAIAYYGDIVFSEE